MNEESNRYGCSFAMCLIYILVYSVIEMLLALEISRLINKDSVLIGILVLSLGSGIPDLLEVIENLKEGESYNAVLQSTGSNVFV